MTEVTTFRAELRRLCKGRGVRGVAALEALGPALTRRMRGSGMSEEQTRVRARAAAWLGTWTAVLPDDLRDAAHVALGLHPDAQHRFLGDRVQWLAEELERDERTARRRVDEALTLLAEAMAESGRETPGPARPRPTAAETGERPGWYFASVRSLVRLDRPAPEAIEERRFVVTADELDRFTVDVSVPRGDGSTPVGLCAEVLFGGTLTMTQHPSESHFRFGFRFPRTLRRGDHHELVIRYSFPAGHVPPHYALTPLLRCDHFQLRLRCPHGSGVRVWRLDGVPPRTLDDPPPSRPAVALDAAHQAAAEFTTLSLGHAYGFRWEVPSMKPAI